MPAVIAKYGGRYLVRGGVVEVVEGDVSVHRQVILEFPDITALKAFYFSEEYKPLKDVRQRAAHWQYCADRGLPSINQAAALPQTAVVQG